MKTYNLKVTRKQEYIIQMYIYDLCNYMFRDKLSDYSDDDFKKYDEYDVLRTKIYFKEHKLNKSYVIFRDLTEEELRFIGKEVIYFSTSGFEREPKEVRMAKRISDNVTKALDLEYQRDLILERILK